SLLAICRQRARTAAWPMPRPCSLGRLAEPTHEAEEGTGARGWRVLRRHHERYARTRLARIGTKDSDPPRRADENTRIQMRDSPALGRLEPLVSRPGRCDTQSCPITPTRSRSPGSALQR